MFIFGHVSLTKFNALKSLDLIQTHLESKFCQKKKKKTFMLLFFFNELLCYFFAEYSFMLLNSTYLIEPRYHGRVRSCNLISIRYPSIFLFLFFTSKINLGHVTS